MLFGTVPDEQIHRAYRFRVAFFSVLVVTIVAALFLITNSLKPFISYTWQRVAGPLATAGRRDRVPQTERRECCSRSGLRRRILRSKAWPRVAEHGSVLAEDILDESLTFLWIRAFLHHQSNIRVIHGDPDDLISPRDPLTPCSLRTAITVYEFPSHIGRYVSHASLRWTTRCPRSWTSVVPRRVP